MKQLTFLLLCLFLQSSYAQKEQVLSDIDFFDYTYKGYSPSVRTCSNERDKNIVVPYFYRELSTEYEEKGMACLYAIPKHEYGMWRVNSLDNVLENRDNADVWAYPPNAESLLYSQRDTLLEHFDVYIFYVRQEELHIEYYDKTDDGEDSPNYYPNDDATMYTYKYENGVWIEKAKEESKGKIPRLVGGIAIDKILRNRFFSILRIQYD
jgi:hypothetical protein